MTSLPFAVPVASAPPERVVTAACAALNVPKVEPNTIAKIAR